MNGTNAVVAQAAVDVAVAMANLPLDALPEVCGFDVDFDRMNRRAAVAVQLSSVDSLRQAVSDLRTWQAELPGLATFHATEYTNSPGSWRLRVVGELAGVRFTVWTGEDIPEDVAGPMRAAPDSERAAAALVDQLLDGGTP